MGGWTASVLSRDLFPTGSLPSIFSVGNSNPPHRQSPEREWQVCPLRKGGAAEARTASQSASSVEVSVDGREDGWMAGWMDGWMVWRNGWGDRLFVMAEMGMGGYCVGTIGM